MSRPLIGLAALAAAVLLAAVPAAAQSALANCKYYTKTQQDFEQGLPYCEACIEDEPDNPEARYFGAWCLAEVGRYEDAWPSFQWLIEREQSKDKKARKYAKWAKDRVQNYFAKHFNRGVEFLKADDTASARDEFRRATHANPLKVEGFLNLGFTQNQLGDLDAALESFRKAIEIAPDNATAYEYYAVALGNKRVELSESETPDEARIAEITTDLKTSLEKVLANKPENDAALLQLGDIAMAEGDDEKGIEYIRRAIGISPENVVKLYNIAVGFYSREDYPNAARVFGMVAEEVGEPTDSLWRDSMYNKALAQTEAALNDDALATVQSLIEADPKEPDYHQLASRVYLAKKDLRKANEHMEKAEALKAAAIEGTPAEGSR